MFQNGVVSSRHFVISFSKWPGFCKLYCSTGDGGRRSQRYHTQNGTVLFSIGLRSSHIHVLRVTVLINIICLYKLTASRGLVNTMKERLI